MRGMCCKIRIHLQELTRGEDTPVIFSQTCSNFVMHEVNVFRNKEDLNRYGMNNQIS